MSAQVLPSLDGSRTHRPQRPRRQKDLLKNGSRTSRIPRNRSYARTNPALRSPYANVYNKTMTGSTMGSPMAAQMKEQAALQYEFELFRQSIQERRTEEANARRARNHELAVERKREKDERNKEAIEAEAERRRRVEEKLVRVRARQQRQEQRRIKQEQEEAMRKQEHMKQMHMERAVLVEEQRRKRAKVQRLVKLEQDRALDNLKRYQQNIGKRRLHLESMIKDQLTEDRQRMEERKRRREQREQELMVTQQRQRAALEQQMLAEQQQQQLLLEQERMGGDDGGFFMTQGDENGDMRGMSRPLTGVILTSEQEHEITLEASALAEAIVNEAISFSATWG